MNLDAKLPDGFKSWREMTVCQKFGVCVCGRAAKKEEPVDAFRFHQKFVQLLRPFLLLKPQPKKNRAQQASADSGGQSAAAGKESAASKEARKSQVRKLLDKSFLVVRFHVPEHVKKTLWAEIPTVWDAWHAAAANVFKMDKDIADEVWFHIRYCNLNTWMFSLMQLQRMHDCPQDAIGNPVIRLQVSRNPVVLTTVQAFQKALHLPLQWNVSWYAIASSAKPIDEEWVVPNTVDVVRLPEADAATACVWRGAGPEASARAELRKRAAEKAQKKRSQNQSQSQKDDKSQKKHRISGKQHESEPQAPQLGQEPNERMPQHPVEGNDDDQDEGILELFEDMRLEAEQMEHTEEAEYAGLHTLAEEETEASLQFTSFHQGKEPEQAEAASSSWEGRPAQAPAHPTHETQRQPADAVDPDRKSSASVPSSASARPHADAEAALAAPVATAKATAAKAKAKSKVAASKRKEITEDVIYIEIDGVWYGSLRYNSKAQTITAHCETAEHRVGCDCRKQKTTAPSERAQLLGKSGRPIGFLVHWLLKGPSFADASQHVHLVQYASLTDRQRARTLFNALEGAQQFSQKAERACRPGEPEEPTEFA